MGILEKIKDIELEMSRTQKNKATEGHLGVLKSKLAKLRTELLNPPKSSGGPGEGFDVVKYGDGRVSLIGFPSVGKSTLLSSLTDTESEAAAYEFTTLTAIPGVIHYNDAKIQLLDLPGIIEGASQGKGRGRQVIACAKSSDLILMVLDACKSEAANSRYEHKEILTRELEAVGLRLNQKPPQIYWKRKKAGGVQVNNTVPGGLTKVDEKTVLKVCQEYKIHHAEILFREDATVDQLIDVLEGNRKYVRCLYVYNKIDALTIEEVDRLSRRPNSVCISCYMNLGMDYLLKRIWDAMGLVRVYTKKMGEKADFEEPVVLSDARGGITVKHFCAQLHAELPKQLKYALVWGTSPKHYGQRVGLKHLLDDEDVVQVVKSDLHLLEGVGRFSTTKRNDPAKLADRKKKEKLKT
jgi:small GTP-binding protein